MISGAAFCPHPPLLVPELAGSAARELERLRDACRTAIASVAGAGGQLVLVGGGPVSRSYTPIARGTMAGYGVPIDVTLGAATAAGAPELPLSLTVGAWLTRDTLGPRTAAMGYSVGSDFASSGAAVELRGLAASRPLALVVLGDASACLDSNSSPREGELAAGFDAAVAKALLSGDGAELAALDQGMGAAVLAAGVPSWQAAGTVLSGTPYDVELSYDEAPYGVRYFVATWTSGDTAWTSGD